MKHALLIVDEATEIQVFDGSLVGRTLDAAMEQLHRDTVACLLEEAVAKYGTTDGRVALERALARLRPAPAPR